MSDNLTIHMTDGRTISGTTCLMDQRGYAKYARQHGELPVTEDAGTFSLWMAYQFYKRQTGESPTFDEFCLDAASLDMDDDAADPTTTATPNISP